MSWRLCPLSSPATKFVNFSEQELIRIFWHEPAVKGVIQQCAFPTVDPPISSWNRVSQAHAIEWINSVPPGYLLNKFITDVGSYTAEERKRMSGWARSTVQMSSDEMKDHLHRIRDPNFSVQDPNSYTSKGHVLQGSIQTDDFRIKVLAYKLNELSCVKFRRLDEQKMPLRFSTPH